MHRGRIKLIKVGAMKKLPGILACTIGAAVAFLFDAALHKLTGFSSVMLVAIALGMLVGNVRPLPATTNEGVRYTATSVLKFGVALLGLAIPAAAIIGLGWKVLATIICVVIAGFVATLTLGKVMGLSRSEALMIGNGCTICGAAAISATHGVLTKKKEHEFVTAIAVIALLGTIMIFLGPAVVATWQPQAAGVFLGGSIHEVSQVVAAGGIAGAAVLPVAVTVKLGRVLLLAPIMAILSAFERRQAEGGKLPPLVPTFVIGFIALVLVRTFIPLPDFIAGTVDWVRNLLFAAAMFAQGTGVTVETMRRAGFRPFIFGVVISLIVATVSLAGAMFL